MTTLTNSRIRLLRAGSASAPFLACLLIGPGALAQNAPAEETAIEEVIVRARAQQLYRVGATDTGKLVTDPLSSTQLITSINAQLIADQGARDAQDIYRNISGVSVFSYGGVTARGFRQEEIFFDGLRGDPYVGFNVPQLFNVERVDFLKGPAGMLYGPGAPGGLFNYATKKPDADAPSRARLVLGNFERMGGSLEVSGELGLDGSAWRAGIFHENRDTPRFNSGDEVSIYDFGVKFALPAETNLVLQATRYEQDLDANRLRGVPVTDDGDFIASRRWNHNEADDFLNLESNVLQALFDGRIGSSLTWDFKIRYSESEQEQNYHEPRQLIDVEGLLGQPTDGTPDLVARQWRDQLRAEDQLTLGTNWVWSENFGAIENRLLAGFEYYDGELAFDGGIANTSSDMIDRFLMGTSLPGDIIPLFLADPNYGQTQPENYAVNFSPTNVTEQGRQGAYLLNEATIGSWILVAGVRYDDYEDETRGGAGFSDSEVTYRVGAVYRLRDDISLYAQWADSYQPQGIGSQQPGTGGPFDPTVGTIVEAGIKTELFDGRIQASAAVYEIIRENILQADPAGDPEGDGIDNFIQFGEVTSQGIEFDITADLTDDWVATLSYAYNDTEITQDNGSGGFSNSVGDRFANAPRNQLGFWTRYQIPGINTAFALGGDYVDERLSLSGQTVQSYTIFDASIIWQRGPFEVLGRIENLFDETYAASGFIERTGHFPGDPRTFFVEVYYEWE